MSEYIEKRFYVFYDENDFVKCCGTAQELVEAGYFNKVSTVIETASKIRAKKRKGYVVILPEKVRKRK